MLRTAPRLLLWLLVAPATHWPRTPAQARAVRRRAPGLLALAAALAAPLLPLALVKPTIVASAGGWPAGTAVEMAQFYLLLAAMAEAVRGLCALGGIEADPVFRRPVLARTPAEFWGRRWNLVVHGFARRYLFLPVARRRGPALAVLATFAASGLMHEYLVLASVGDAATTGPGSCWRSSWRKRRRCWRSRACSDRGWPAAPGGTGRGAAPLLAAGDDAAVLSPAAPQIAAFDQACAAGGRAVGTRVVQALSSGP